jgi:heptaprenyl diphosphate synthase
MVLIIDKHSGKTKVKLPKTISSKTVPFFSEKIKPEILFICTLAVLAVFLFIKDIRLLWIFTGIFFAITLLRRGKIKILPSILITVSVTFFALLSPYGKVLFKIGSFRITKDALITGLHRSAILTGMVFLSQFAVSPQLHLPGKAGEFLAMVFTWLDKLTEQRISFKPGQIISSIDNRLCQIWNTDIKIGSEKNQNE